MPSTINPKLNDLVPTFQNQVQTLLNNCERRGVTYVPYSTVRTPIEQCSLWRQSRSSTTVQNKIQELQSQGLMYLAQCIIDAGPSSGPHVTNAIGGLSWHNYGEAVDCYALVNGKASWDKRDYYIYCEEAEKLWLYSYGARLAWDYPHVNQRPFSAPHKIYSLTEIDRIMRQLYSS